ncbi:unnamed protein product [Jaminaea pallidilutea]
MRGAAIVLLCSAAAATLGSSYELHNRDAGGNQQVRAYFQVTSSSTPTRRGTADPTTLTRRHGDHAEAETSQDGLHDAMEATASPSSAQPSHDVSDAMHSPLAGSSAAQSAALEHQHSHGNEHKHEHGHVDTEAAQTMTMVAAVPDLGHGHGGGHSHAHSNAPVLTHLNESKLLASKGPEPLSYMEWDWAYGIGHEDVLRLFTHSNFTSVDQTSETGAMARVGGRHRKLFDEPDAVQRKRLTDDIQSRVGTSQKPLVANRYATLITLHIIGAVLSCFILLPLTLFLKAAHSSFAPLLSAAYLVTLLSSLLLSALYKTLTPQLYPRNSHGALGWVTFWLSTICLSGDVLRLINAHITRLLGSRAKLLPGPLSRLLRSSSSSREHSQSSTYSPLEENALLCSEPTDMGAMDVTDERPLSRYQAGSHHWRSSEEQDDGQVSPGSTLVGPSHNGRRSGSGSEVARHESYSKFEPISDHAFTSPFASATSSYDEKSRPDGAPARATSSQKTLLQSAFRYAHVTTSRSLVILAFVAAYTGLAVYTGTCRSPYKNGCLAHGIKGGIFFWYGLLTFGRYMGAYADCGWAWNKRPSNSDREQRHGGWKATMPSAEWVECLIIFIYGATNTWMERFEAKSGDPYTVKQVQHISIAVMFWFAGALGLALETRWVRELINLPISQHHPSASRPKLRSRLQASGDQEALVAAQAPPPSYAGSFNPFPALCIGVTGIVMAAHHQDYVYQVQIHALWGQLLAGFAVLRCLTYFFLWLRPPTSVLPSRPPTEALASLSLTAGGVVFMISTEEVSFAAMRNGFGDFMAILCITVALVCFLFALIAALIVIKACAVRREMRQSMHQSCSKVRSERNERGMDPVYTLEDRTEAQTTSSGHNGELA